MFRYIFPFLSLLLVTIPAFAMTGAVIGDAAPAFSATGSNGETVTLEGLKGKVVVLEWTNDGCPFVKKHYDSGNMQALQKKAAADDVVWLSVISSAPGKQGHVDGAGANELTKSRDAAPAAVLLDPEGAIGRLYDAKTTPHMFVIDKDGVLVYRGAIDSISSADPADIEKSTNYVDVALEALKTGGKIEVTSTTAYGCSVKYAG